VGRVGRLLLREPDLGERGPGDLDRLVLLAALDLLLRDGEVAQHRHVREQVELLEDHPDARPQLVDVRVGVGDLLALDEDLPARRGLEHVDAAQEGRLPGPGRTDDADHLAVRDVEVDALEHLVVAEVLVEVLDVDHRGRAVAGVVGGRGGHQRALSARLSMRRTTIDSGTVISR
jgi:hypothetical protein